MTSSAPLLPEARIASLYAAYERDAAKRRRVAYAALFALFVLVMLAGHVAEVKPLKALGNIGEVTDYFYRIAPEIRRGHVFEDFAEWMSGYRGWLRLLFETILMAYLATLFGALAGFFLSFLAAGNLSSNRYLRFGARRFLEFLRTVPDIVFALIFVRAFGLGAMAGVFALTVHTTGSLGKLFSEEAENADPRPVEGVRAPGATFAETVRYAVLPQVLPAFLSYGLLRFEINVRTATVIGFVGAGGIGQEFIEAIRTYSYSLVSAILFLIVITVFIIDIVTSALRARVMRSAELP